MPATYKVEMNFSGVPLRSAFQDESKHHITLPFHAAIKSGLTALG